MDVLNNLKAEMARRGVRNCDIQKVLKCSESTIKNKICGKSEFTVREAMVLRNALFPEIKIEYLFPITYNQVN